MTTSRMRGLVIGVLLASCAALPATAQAATPTLTTTIPCIDPTVDQNIDVIATGLAPNASDYPLFDLVEGADGDTEVGGPTVGNLDADASGTGTATVFFDSGAYAANIAGAGPVVWLKLRDPSDWSLVAELAIPICGADTTAPVLSLPAPITVDAASAAGAAVTYPATATDDVDGTVPVTCTPASGATFAVGTTAVDCSASDAAGNAVSGNFTVTVKPLPAPQPQTQPDLRSLLTTGALRDAYDRFVASGRTKNACNALNTLINEIRARTGTQPGKALTPAQGERVTAAVRLLGAALGCR